MADIRVPTLGESVTEATVGKWFKQPGDAVTVDEPLVELETDKVTLEVPAPAAGVLSEVAVKNGDTVAVGALLGQIKEGVGAAPKASAPAAKPEETRSRRLLCKDRLKCRRRPRYVRWLQKVASIRRKSAAPACTGRSPKETC